MGNPETMMDKYADVIMRELNLRDVACIYEQCKQQVYTCFVSCYGYVWGTYGYDHPEITACSVYSLAVPACRRDKVEEYLASANQSIKGGGFYIDRITGNIVFSSVYDTSGADTDPDTGSFTTFCRLGCDLFLEHQEALYGLVYP